MAFKTLCVCLYVCAAAAADDDDADSGVTMGGKRSQCLMAPAHQPAGLTF